MHIKKARRGTGKGCHGAMLRRSGRFLGILERVKDFSADKFIIEMFEILMNRHQSTVVDITSGGLLRFFQLFGAQ